jgi:hypothetical protein
MSVTLSQQAIDRVSRDFNAVINFALDKAGVEGLTFLALWREGAWDEINREWPEFKTPDAV